MKKSAKELSNMKAQEFIFQASDEVQTIQDGQIAFCSKQELTNALFSATGKRGFSQIEKTAHHSFTFLPKEEHKVPVRVFLNEVDLKKNNPNGYEEYFENLSLTCRTQNRIEGVKNLAIKVGATVTIAAVSLAGAAGFLHAYEGEREYQEEKMASYMEQIKDAQLQDEIRQQAREENKKIAEEEKQLIDDILNGWEQENESQAHK